MNGGVEPILRKLFQFYGYPGEDANIVINQDTFIGIFSDGDKPVFGSLRTIREKWKVLHCLGYLKSINGRASTLDVPRLLKALETEE
jgi:hypothetical protein